MSGGLHDPTGALAKLSTNPKKTIDSARKGTIQELMAISNVWSSCPNAPELLDLGLIDVFLPHLDGSLVPVMRGPSLRNSPTVDRAWVSIAGLSKIGPFFYEPDHSPAVEKAEKDILNKWDDIFKWCSFFYNTRIASPSGRQSAPAIPPQIQRSTLDIVAALLYALTRSEPIRRTMASTPGSLEMVTRMWILEDECPVPTQHDIPACTAALDGLLRVPDTLEMARMKKPNETDEEREERLEAEASSYRTAVNTLLDRVVKTAGGSSRNVIQLSLLRIKKIIASPQIATPFSAINLDLMGHFCRSSNHELRTGFLSEGAIKLCTKTAVTICGMLDQSLRFGLLARARLGYGGPTSLTPTLPPREDNLVNAMVASIGFLTNTLESTDGFSWVNASLNAGLLTSWTGAAKYMKYMHPEDADMIMMVLREILPRYLVYRSVIVSVKNSVQRLRGAKVSSKKGSKKAEANWDLAKRKGDGDELDMVQWPPEARTVWRKFEKLALERYVVNLHMKAVKGKVVTCDNVECQKTDTKNNFMKCGGCSTSMYCSKECQVKAWKTGGHKNVCKLKQTEILEGKYEIISKSDADFFHHLSTRDARHNMPLLRRMAKASYPDLPPTALVICIDYRNYPTKFSVHPLSEYEKYAPPISPDASANSEARNDELVNRAREHPGKYGVVQSKIVNGQSMQLVLSVVPGMFWDDAGWTVDKDDIDYRAEEDDDEEEEEAFLAKLKEKGDEGLDVDDSERFSGQQVGRVDTIMARMQLDNILKDEGLPPMSFTK